MPLLCPFKVRTNSQELVDHTWKQDIVSNITSTFSDWNLDGSVPAGRDNVFVVEVNDVHSRSVPNQHSPQVDLGRTHHVPDLVHDVRFEPT